MAGFDQILYVGLVGGGLYLAYTTGLLDQAGQAIVTATQPKQASGWAKKHKKVIEILEQPLMVPSHPKRIRMTIA